MWCFYDPAFRYGGRADYSRGTEIEPGVDCPHGSTTHFAFGQVAKTSRSYLAHPKESKLSPIPGEQPESRPRRRVLRNLAAASAIAATTGH